MSSFLAKTCTFVDRESEDWERTEWFLQSTFRSSSVSLRSLWVVSHPSIVAQFERRKGSFPSFCSVILSEDLKIPIRQVCEFGFAESTVVLMGNQILPRSVVEIVKSFGNTQQDKGSFRRRKREGGNGGRKVFECLIVRAVVGLSEVVEKAADASFKHIEAHYDSIFVKELSGGLEMVEATSTMAYDGHDITEQNCEGVLAPQAFKHTYLLRDGSQLLPMYVCRFEVDEGSRELLALRFCDNCETRPATIWCKADEASLCEDCDKISHSNENKITGRHERVPINERHNQQTRCHYFPNETATWWDNRRLIALSDKALREEESDDFVKNNLVCLRDAYKSSIKIATREASFIRKLKEALHKNITHDSDAIRIAETEIGDAISQLKSAVEIALNKAKSIVDENSQSIDQQSKILARMLEFIQWAQTLLIPYSASLAPSVWLNLWVAHIRLVLKTLNTSSFFIDKKTQADYSSSSMEKTIILSLHGQMRVHAAAAESN